MRLLGLEPKTYGLKVRSAKSPKSNSQSTSGDSQNDLAFCLALLAQIRPDLGTLASQWDALPEPVRAGILAMVEVSTRPTTT
jgi:hypothetical protein